MCVVAHRFVVFLVHWTPLSLKMEQEEINILLVELVNKARLNVMLVVSKGAVLTIFTLGFTLEAVFGFIFF